MNRNFSRLFKIGAFIAALLFFSAKLRSKEMSYSGFSVTVTGKGQPIILIPGATCSGAEWDETVAHYKGKYQCHVLTLAGYAGTKPLQNAPYLPEIKDQVARYIADHDLRNVVIVGHSIGGFLALCLASEMKDRLQKVVIVDALPFFAGVYNPNASDTFSVQQAEASYASYNKMTEKELKENQLKTAAFLCRDSTRWDLIAEWGSKSDRKTMAYTMAEMLGNDMRQKISTIKVPALVLGAYCAMPDYPMYSRASVVSLYNKQYEACKTCDVQIATDNTKHFIVYDNPEWYFASMDKFLTN
jgi:N-formylmaleamate deformylase